ncbi:hypothetical protein E5288_WYG005693 [Bos mutus]|uniref:Uncharacterized protein n=1 Tax=Bos mutus TaxID=72004 RepID=A0A6B0RTZ8_9CETA|nr:hypothetical protein [Bos mutus]
MHIDPGLALSRLKFSALYMNDFYDTTIYERRKEEKKFYAIRAFFSGFSNSENTHLWQEHSSKRGPCVSQYLELRLVDQRAGEVL